MSFVYLTVVTFWSNHVFEMDQFLDPNQSPLLKRQPGLPLGFDSHWMTVEGACHRTSHIDRPWGIPPPGR